MQKLDHIISVAKQLMQEVAVIDYKMTAWYRNTKNRYLEQSEVLFTRYKQRLQVINQNDKIRLRRGKWLNL